MEIVKGLDPATLGVVGAIFILREVFAFLKHKKDKPDPVPKEMHAELHAMTESVRRVGEHIVAQTELLRSFISELKAMREEIERFKKELYDVSDRVRELN